MLVTREDLKYAINYQKKRLGVIKLEFKYSLDKNMEYCLTYGAVAHELATEIKECEIGIASLKTALSMYECTIVVEVPNAGNRSLAYCLRAKKVAKKMEKMWWEICTDKIIHQKSLSVDKRSAMKHMMKAHEQATIFDKFIKEASKRKLEINIDEKLFPGETP